jgi:mannose/fructose/N-acetylgalactosamine-specific phosphotransferase system component IIC
MTKRKINRLIGYGILVFIFGFFAGQFLFTYLQFLIPIGTLVTFTGVFFYFKTTNLINEFTKYRNEDILTYFWNVIVLKLWTFIFVLWMITVNIILLSQSVI